MILKDKKIYTPRPIDKIKVQTIFSYWKLPYIDCWFILFLLKRLITLSIKNCLFLFLFFFFLASCVLSTNWLTYLIVCLLKFPSGIFRFFPLSIQKRSGKFGFFCGNIDAYVPKFVLKSLFEFIGISSLDLDWSIDWLID